MLYNTNSPKNQSNLSTFDNLFEVDTETQSPHNNPIFFIFIIDPGTLQRTGEHMSWLQVLGLGVILASVLLINLSKYRQRKAIAGEVSTVKTERKLAVTGTGKSAVCAD